MGSLPKFYFVVEYSKDGIFWNSKEFVDYDTAQKFIKMMQNYFDHTRMYEV